jgi:hypothetical protein
MYLSKENWWLSKKGRRAYLKLVNPQVRPTKDYVPTDAEILQHCHIDCVGSDFKPMWKPELNNYIQVIKGYRLMNVVRR